MASLNRAAWLPSKVTKLRSGKTEHRPGGKDEEEQDGSGPLGRLAGESKMRVPGSWDWVFERVQRSQGKEICHARSHSEMRDPTELWERTHRPGEEAFWERGDTEAGPTP